jgi:hypothetical protein
MTTINYRPDDATDLQLRERAEAEGVSMNNVINRAVREYLARHARRDQVRAIAEVGAADWAELLERLK